MTRGTSIKHQTSFDPFDSVFQLKTCAVKSFKELSSNHGLLQYDPAEGGEKASLHRNHIVTMHKDELDGPTMKSIGIPLLINRILITKESARALLNYSYRYVIHI